MAQRIRRRLIDLRRRGPRARFLGQPGKLVDEGEEAGIGAATCAPRCTTRTTTCVSSNCRSRRSGSERSSSRSARAASAGPTSWSGTASRWRRSSSDTRSPQRSSRSEGASIRRRSEIECSSRTTCRAGSVGGSPRDIQEAIELLAVRRVTVADLITHVLPLAEAGKGFRLVAQARDSIKVVLRP